jgi:hypothetical protein
MAKNLRGARSRLAEALDGGTDLRGLDLRALLREVDERLERLDRDPAGVLLDAPPLRRVAR